MIIFPFMAALSLAQPVEGPVTVRQAEAQSPPAAEIRGQIALPQGVEDAPALPRGLAREAQEDRSGVPMEGQVLSAEAMMLAVRAYQNGDFTGALLHAERAAAAGDARGATLAGHIYLHGLGRDASDDEAAVRWLTRAGQAGEGDALVILARMAEAERGGLSVWQARDFLSQAAESGDAQAAFDYGVYLKDQGDPARAGEVLDWLRMAAEAGVEPAYGELAYTLDQWPHGPQDPAQALIWYQRAGDAGDGFGALQAGLMLLEADPQSSEGIRYMRLGAELGLPAAMGQYGLLLYQGRAGQAGDPRGAAYWFEQGAKGGDSESQFLYAYALASGDGVVRDMREAYLWVVRAGLPRDDVISDDPQRDRLEAMIEAALPPNILPDLEAEAIAGAPRLQ
ncbi:tetratricopeptide repeat protein [Woodsholea maritima]|uniref:tetratricopeptide repeat protein n=1 Tax=Woodsholea maritima TaxID=240237 RepID=UPI000377769A|nr:sel1 repeat family protein [Woodsholea maritima]